MNRSCQFCIKNSDQTCSCFPDQRTDQDQTRPDQLYDPHQPKKLITKASSTDCSQNRSSSLGLHGTSYFTYCSENDVNQHFGPKLDDVANYAHSKNSTIENSIENSIYSLSKSIGHSSNESSYISSPDKNQTFSRYLYREPLHFANELNTPVFATVDSPQNRMQSQNNSPKTPIKITAKLDNPKNTRSRYNTDKGRGQTIKSKNSVDQGQENGKFTLSVDLENFYSTVDTDKHANYGTDRLLDKKVHFEIDLALFNAIGPNSSGESEKIGSIVHKLGILEPKKNAKESGSDILLTKVCDQDVKNTEPSAKIQNYYSGKNKCQVSSTFIRDLKLSTKNTPECLRQLTDVTHSEKIDRVNTRIFKLDNLKIDREKSEDLILRPEIEKLLDFLTSNSSCEDVSARSLDNNYNRWSSSETDGRKISIMPGKNAKSAKYKIRKGSTYARKKDAIEKYADVKNKEKCDDLIKLNEKYLKCNNTSVSSLCIRYRVRLVDNFNGEILAWNYDDHTGEESYTEMFHVNQEKPPSISLIKTHIENDDNNPRKDVLSLYQSYQNDTTQDVCKIYRRPDDHVVQFTLKNLKASDLISVGLRYYNDGGDH